MTSALLNKVWEGDCLKLMEEISNQSVDMVLADLPYATTANKWDKPIDLQTLWQQYKRILQPKGVIVLTSQGRFTAQLIESNPEWFKYKVVWIKSVATNYLNAKKQPLRKHEDICVFYKQQPIYHPQMGEGKPYIATRHPKPNNNYGIHTSTTSKSCGARYPTDILSYNEDYIQINSAVAEGNVFHPTQKPVALGRYLIRTYTDPGQVVLDNTCGSGSFLVASILEYRNFIGIEKNKNATQFRKHVDYLQICNRRIQEAYDSIKTDHF